MLLKSLHQPNAAEVLHNPNQAFVNTSLVSFQPAECVLIDLEGLYWRIKLVFVSRRRTIGNFNFFLFLINKTGVFNVAVKAFGSVSCSVAEN